MASIATSQTGEQGANSERSLQLALAAARTAAENRGQDIKVLDMRELTPLYEGLGEVDGEIGRQVERDALYATYLERQRRDIDSLEREESCEIPKGFDFSKLSGLSNELKDKLRRIEPETLGQASRIEGMTPAALTLILAKLRQADRKRSA